MTKGERIRLGIFSIFGFLLIALFLYLTIGRSMLEKNDYYFVEYTEESVSGLNIGNAVKMRGVSIGKVEDISFAANDPGKIVVKISVKKDIRIPGDAVAVIEVFGITGMKYIDLVRGTNAGAPREKGSVLPSGVSTIGMVTGKAEDIAQKIEVALNNIIAITGSEKVQNLVMSSSETVTSIDHLVRNLNGLINENRTAISSISQNINSVSGRLASDGAVVVNKAVKILDRFDSAAVEFSRVASNKSMLKGFKNFEEVTAELQKGVNGEQLKKTVANLNRTLETANQSAADMGRTFVQSRDRINQILDRLEATTRNLSDFTAKIRENPSLLIRKQEY